MTNLLHHTFFFERERETCYMLCSIIIVHLGRCCVTWPLQNNSETKVQAFLNVTLIVHDKSSTSYIAITAISNCSTGLCDPSCNSLWPINVKPSYALTEPVCKTHFTGKIFLHPHCSTDLEWTARPCSWWNHKMMGFSLLKARWTTISEGLLPLLPSSPFPSVQWSQ